MGTVLILTIWHTWARLTSDARRWIPGRPPEVWRLLITQLPLTPESQRRQEVYALFTLMAEACPVSGDGSMRVLLIEDDAAVAASIELMLRSRISTSIRRTSAKRASISESSTTTTSFCST